MKNKILLVIAIAVVLGGIWYFWPENFVEPEITLSPTPSASISVLPTPTPSPQPKKTPKPTVQATPTATPTPTIAPIINSVTAYQKTDEPAPGWWISIVGILPNACSQLLSPSFSQDDNTFLVSLPAQSSAQCTQYVQTFTQRINIAPASLAPGLYTVSVNDRELTSFIIESPTPSPTY